MKKANIVFVFTCLLFVVFTCTNLTNPFLDKQGAKAQIAKKSFSSSDSVGIFSTQTIQVHIYLKEHLDSFKVHIDNNRLWKSNDSIIPSSNFLQEHSFSFSFFDTGWQTIKVVSYVNNGDTFIDSCTVYAKSPLIQAAISGSIGDSVLLSTEPVKDNQVLYVWDLHNGIKIKESTPTVKIKLTSSFTSQAGELYVEDLANHRSPVELFKITSLEQSELNIVCKNDSVLEDSVYSTSASLKFSLDVSGAQLLRNAKVNGKAFDDSLRMGELFVLNYYVHGLDTIKAPVKLDVSVTDNLGRNISKSFYVHYIKINPVINVLYPMDSMQTASSSVSIQGNIKNFQQYNSIYLLAKNNGAVKSKINITSDNTVFSFDISIPNPSNHITLILYPDSQETGTQLANSDFYVFYNPEFVDTNPPQIRNIRCNGDLVNTNYTSRTDSMLLEIDVVDNSKLTVAVNGKTVTKDKDGLFYSTQVFLEHKKDSTVLVINATDSLGYSSQDTIYVKYNRLPQWIKTPSYSVITAGERSDFEIDVSDPDNDTLFVTMVIKHKLEDIVLNASSGKTFWHPEISDTGTYKVKLTARDGYDEYIETIFDLVVKGSGAVPVKFLTTKEDFPDTVFIGNSIKVALLEIPLTGTRPFSYAALFIDNNDKILKTIHDGKDSVLQWTATVADTGVKKLRIMIKDSCNFMDTIDTDIHIMKEIVAFIRWENNYTPKFSEDDMYGRFVRLIMKPALDHKVSIPYNISFPEGDDSAKKADLNVSLNGVFNFDKNDTVASVMVSVVNDTVPEYTEKFEVRIIENDSIKFASGVDNVFHGEIIDNDMVYFYFNETEAARREKDTVYTAIVKLSKPLEKKLELTYKIDQSSTAELGKDFTIEGTDNKVIFNPGEVRAEIKINIIEDIFPEQDEEIVLKLNSDIEFADSKDGLDFVYTIINEDIAPKFSFHAAEASGSESKSEVKVRITLDREIDTNVVLQLSVSSDNSLKAGVDFSLSHNYDTLIFSKGETQREIILNVVDDTIPEDGGVIRFNLSSNSDLVLPGYNTSFRYTIIANEVKVTINAQSSNVNEWTWHAIPITFQLSNPAESEFRVYFKADDNSTADSGKDYRVEEPGYIIFKPGEASKDMTYYIIDDTEKEETETAIFRIVSVSDNKVAYIGQESLINVYIEDNDNNYGGYPW